MENCVNKFSLALHSCCLALFAAPFQSRFVLRYEQHQLYIYIYAKLSFGINWVVTKVEPKRTPTDDVDKRNDSYCACNEKMNEPLKIKFHLNFEGWFSLAHIRKWKVDGKRNLLNSRLDHSWILIGQVKCNHQNCEKDVKNWSETLSSAWQR